MHQWYKMRDLRKLGYSQKSSLLVLVVDVQYGNKKFKCNDDVNEVPKAQNTTIICISGSSQ